MLHHHHFLAIFTSQHASAAIWGLAIAARKEERRGRGGLGWSFRCFEMK